MRKWCPPGAVFSAKSAQCINSALIPECNPNPNDGPFTPRPTCYGSEKVALRVCSSEFIQCVNGQPARKFCPGATVFDARSSSCLSPDLLAECRGTPTQPTDPVCGFGVKYVAVGECEEEFIRCVDGKAVRKWCGAGLAFDSRLYECLDVGAIAACGYETATPACNTGAKYVALGPCHESFIRCVDGTAIQKWCSAGKAGFQTDRT